MRGAWRGVSEFRLLGAVRCFVDGRAVDVGPARQRSVLAALLVDANQVVSAEQLVDRVWGGQPPSRARETLYSHVSRVRGALAGLPDVGLARRSGGYVLSVDPAAVDLHRHREMAGRSRAGLTDEAVAGRLSEILQLWRGEPFAGIDTPWFAALRSTLERERLAVELDRNDVLLRRGEHAAVLGELEVRAAQEPTDERIAAQLMLALYRSGRQADALDHFDRLRRHLSGELGIDPGPVLRLLHEQILRADAALLAPSRPAADRPAPPRQLPAAVRLFTGRTEELAALDVLLDGGAQRTAPSVVVLSGTAGVGKTALAVAWARRASGRFPDGQLHVDLRGYDPDLPLPAGAALGGFLRALGLAGPDVPLDVEERSALFRSLTDGRRMLVVLDNASSVEQVRPLLPGSAEAAVLVTSRDGMPGLVARDGALRHELERLAPAAAGALLRVLIGDRVDQEVDAVAELARLCAGLPLALRVAAELATARPDAALADLVDELADEQRRLDLLGAGGDPRTAVRAVFSWSYRALADDTARAFRLLGLHPGPDWDASAAAALTGTDLHAARQALGTLVRLHLVEGTDPGRHRMHDLLRAYAVDRGVAEDPEPHRAAALTRLLDHAVASASSATASLDAGGEPAAGARSRLDAERVALICLGAHAAARGLPGHTVRLARILSPYLQLGGHYAEAVTVLTGARRAAATTGDRHAEATLADDLGAVHRMLGRYGEAAAGHRDAAEGFRACGDPAGQARALDNLGQVRWQQGRYRLAIDHHEEALALHRAGGDRSGEAYALTRLGFVCRRQGFYRRAIEYHRRGLVLFRELGDISRESYALTSLGLIHARQGRERQAVAHHRRALDLFRVLGDRCGEAYALDNLGLVRCRQGRYADAADHHGESLLVTREIGDRAGEAYALDHLGVVHRMRGEYPQALARHEEAIALSRRIGERPGEAKALNGLAETHHAVGDRAAALRGHRAALALAERIEDLFERARAHHGLARIHHEGGDVALARRHGRLAVELYRTIEVPDGAAVTALLESGPSGVSGGGAHPLRRP